MQSNDSAYYNTNFLTPKTCYQVSVSVILNYLIKFLGSEHLDDIFSDHTVHY